MADHDSPPASSALAPAKARRWQCYRWLFVISALLLATPSLARGDELLDTAWKLLARSQSEPALELLESAVLEEPERAEYWAALLNILSESSVDRYLVTCYVNAALKAHPDSLEIHWARLRCLHPTVALDELETLAAREPDKQKLSDAREILEMRLRLPRNWQQASFYEGWAMQCLEFERWDAAARVAKLGLALNPKAKQLRTIEARVFLQQGKYELAYAALNQAEFQQALKFKHVQARFPTIGDELLAKQQPEWAVQAFGPKPDEAIVHSREGLVLAQALLQAGKLERAEEVFSQTEPLGAALLVIGNLLDLKQTGAARDVADQLLADWPEAASADDKDRQPCHAMDMRWSGSWPVALEPQFKQAVTWLWKTYPQHKELLEIHLPAPADLFQREAAPVKLCSARTVLDNLPAGKAPDEYVPGHGWPEVGQREKFDFYRRVLLEPPGEKPRIRTDLSKAQKWAASLRQTCAISYYSGHLRELIRARQLVFQLQRLQANYTPRVKIAVLTAEQIGAEVQRMNPAVRVQLIKALAPNTNHGQDRTPVVQLLEQHATVVDVPDLMSTLRIVTRESTENDRRSEAALHKALEKITGVQNTTESTEDRVLFWEAWWQANLVRVLAETEFSDLSRAAFARGVISVPCPRNSTDN
jgi:tetratricopeptide (TPR) repeat protein